MENEIERLRGESAAHAFVLRCLLMKSPEAMTLLRDRLEPSEVASLYAGLSEAARDGFLEELHVLSRVPRQNPAG